MDIAKVTQSTLNVTQIFRHEAEKLTYEEYESFKDEVLGFIEDHYQKGNLSELPGLFEEWEDENRLERGTLSSMDSLIKTVDHSADEELIDTMRHYEAVGRSPEELQSMFGGTIAHTKCGEAVLVIDSQRSVICPETDEVYKKSRAEVYDDTHVNSIHTSAMLNAITVNSSLDI